MSRSSCVAACLASLFLAPLLSGCGGPSGNGLANKALPPSYIPDLSAEVKAVLAARQESIEALAAETLIVEAVQAANRDHADWTMAQIKTIDEQWQQAEEINELIKPFLTNACAQYLVDFQELRDGFPEIFVTDQRGLIVAETNRTSDYYQADELWWQRAFNRGNGHGHHGPIEYDESAMSECISLNVPVMDPKTGKAIGVVKAVCDITAIKLEL